MEHLTSSGTAVASDTHSDYAKRPCPRITIGHATRLQLFSPDEWRALADAISGLPITFVGLPQSDMYMQGRAFQDEPLGAPRGTLRVPYLAQRYGIEIAMSVNNVDNAFTPQGSLDPLSLCSFGVGIFQAATSEDIRVLMVCHNPFFSSISNLLYVSFFWTFGWYIFNSEGHCLPGFGVGPIEPLPMPASKRQNGITKLFIFLPLPYQRSVTLTSRIAITGTKAPIGLAPCVGDQADFVILHERETLQSAVLDPPFERTTIKGGRIVACRRSVKWFSDGNSS